MSKLGQPPKLSELRRRDVSHERQLEPARSNQPHQLQMDIYSRRFQLREWYVYATEICVALLNCFQEAHCVLVHKAYTLERIEGLSVRKVDYIVPGGIPYGFDSIFERTVSLDKNALYVVTISDTRGDGLNLDDGGGKCSLTVSKN